MEKSDSQLIQLFFERNEKAIELTEKAYGRYLYTVCFNILAQKQDCEECVNTVLLKVWNSIPPQKPNNLKSFIGRIAHNEAIDCYRKNNSGRRSAFIDSLDDLSEILTDDLSAADEREAFRISELLNGFLKKLPEKERICFIKRYYHGYTLDSISKQMGIPKSTLFSMLENLKSKLKTLLED